MYKSILILITDVIYKKNYILLVEKSHSSCDF